MNEDRALATLGLESGASPREIKRAYLDLVQICHPDKHRGQSERVRTKAEKQFKEVGQAYELLKSLSGDTRTQRDSQAEPDQQRQQQAERQAAEDATRRAGERRAADEAQRQARKAEKPSGVRPSLVALGLLFLVAVIYLGRADESGRRAPLPSSATTPSPPRTVTPPAASATTRSASPPRSATAPSALTTAGAGDFRVPVNWQGLREGMTEEEVIALLGVPTPDIIGLVDLNRMRNTNTARFVYKGRAGDFGVVRGTVRFKSGRVSSSSAPIFVPLPAIGNFRVPANWRRLRRGMTEEQVIALLGVPTSRSGPVQIMVFTFAEFVYEGRAGDFGVVRGTVRLWADDILRLDDMDGRLMNSSAPSFEPLPE